ncbi:MAG TPA: response regulator [Azospirillaceae bacterium]|nr:response regulator [Azospirillaceae bacterium]HRQ80384.1 response regulator [Azospirillaceae bacterium]
MTDAAELDDPLTHLEEGEGDVGVDCQTAAEFYAPTARRAIGRYCRRFLNENALTPTELLHSARHQQTLSNIPVFVGILQQVERSRSRKGTLNGLVNDIARVTRERIKDNPPPDLTPDTWEDELARLAAGPDPELGGFLAEAALVAHILPNRNYAERASALTTLAGTAKEDARPLAMADGVLGEMMAAESALASITGDAPFGRTVGYIVTLMAGDMPLADDAPQTLRRLDKLLRRWPMPQLRDGLARAFVRELRRPNHFTIASMGDLFGIEAIQRELMTLAEIAGRLRNNDGFIGGDRIEESLQRRGALLVNEDALHEMLRGRPMIEKLRTLFMLQKLPLPITAERAINAYIEQFFASRDFAGRLLDCWKDQKDKLKGVAEVQRLVNASVFLEHDREAMAGMLDDIQAAFLRTQRILGRLTGKEDAPPDLVLDIAKLAAEKAFCEGKTKTAVARALHRQTHRPRFIRAFLLGGEGPKVRLARTAWLRSALAAVGSSFVDLSASKVLVADDEDGPRNFVESVLQDLGVAQIVSAKCGVEALELFEQENQKLDLIICDWMMPRLSGVEVLRHVRQAQPELPFLMVTALATPKAVHKALEYRVSGYIAKPFTPDQLEDKVLTALALRGIRGES